MNKTFGTPRLRRLQCLQKRKCPKYRMPAEMFPYLNTTASNLLNRIIAWLMPLYSACLLSLLQNLHQKSSYMFKNYLKTAWRNIARTIGYSVLNVAGLAIGMAVALLIGLWVYHQYSFDRFLPEYKSVYRVQRNFYSNGDTLTFQTTSL